MERGDANITPFSLNGLARVQSPEYDALFPHPRSESVVLLALKQCVTWNAETPRPLGPQAVRDMASPLRQRFPLGPQNTSGVEHGDANIMPCSLIPAPKMFSSWPSSCV